MYILLYSKYSRSCLKLLDNVEQLNRMTPTPMVQLVCIDNKQTRKQILNSKAIEIKKVPCLLILDDTTVEKYDGERAFQWVSEVFQKLNVQNQPPPPPPPPQTVIEIEPPVSQPKVRTQSEERKRPKNQPKKQTKIEDLDDISEEEEEDDEDTENQSKIRKPPIPNRNGAGTYSIDEDTFSEPEIERVEKKSSNSGSKGGGILDLAFAMRQEREKENKDNNK